MKFRKILLTYLFASFIPPIVLLLTGVLFDIKNCPQCIALLLIASTLMLSSLLILNSIQFLGMIRFKNNSLDIILRVIYAFIAPIILCITMIYNYWTTGYHKIDFGLPFLSLISEFLLCFYTLFVLLKIRNVN